MKLVLAKHGEVPPDGYRFTDPDTGHLSFALDEDTWFKAIRKHRIDNGLEPIEKADVYDQFCKLLPPGWSKYEDGTKPDWFVNTRLSARDVLNGTKSLARFIIAGAPLVSRELASSRSATCSKCYFNVATSGCWPCLGLQGVIDTIGGSIKTPSDTSLRSCAVCKCSTKAKTRLPIDLIKKGETQETLSRYPSFCWIPNELSIDTEQVIT